MYGESLHINIYEPKEIDNFDKLAAKFDCGNFVLNYFLQHNAKTDKSHTTYIFLDETSHTIVGYTSFQCSGMLNTVRQKPAWRITEPAIQINFFALDAGFHHMKYSPAQDHFYLSDFLLQSLIRRLEDIADNVIAARQITVYAVPTAEKFYHRNDFRPFTEYIGGNAKIRKITKAIPDEWSFIDQCIPMFLAIE